MMIHLISLTEGISNKLQELDERIENIEAVIFEGEERQEPEEEKGEEEDKPVKIKSKLEKEEE